MSIRGTLARFRSTPDRWNHEAPAARLESRGFSCGGGSQPGNAVTTICCCACGDEVTEWTAVLWQHEQGLPDGWIEPLDGVDIRCWCLPCGEPLKAQVCQAVANALNAGHKRGRRP